MGTLLCFALGIYIAVEVFILRRLPEGFGRFWGLPAFWLITGIAIIFIRKKQSPAEVDCDERDNFIKRRAVLASFVSVWILLFVSSMIPRFIVGQDGSIPVWMLPIINLGVFFNCYAGLLCGGSGSVWPGGVKMAKSETKNWFQKLIF